MPILAAPTRRELATLLRPSPEMQKRSGARACCCAPAWLGCRPAPGWGGTRWSARSRPARRRISPTLHARLFGSAVLNAVIHAASTRAVSRMDSFLPSWDPAGQGRSRGRPGRSGHLEGAARAGGGLLEDQAMFLPFRCCRSVPDFLAFFSSADRCSR